jgi:hypothetical protein
VFDVFLEGRPPLREQSPDLGFAVGDLLYEGRWRVEQVVPTPQGPSDFEVFAKRTRLNYLVVEEQSRRCIGSHSSDHTLVSGEVITVGVKRWKVSAVDDNTSFELFDAVVTAVRPAGAR